MASKLKTPDHPEREMLAAFSFLLHKDAEQAIAATLEHFKRRLEAGLSCRNRQLLWADFGQDGQYIRGGSSDRFSPTARVVAWPQDDPQIAAIAGHVAREHAAAGDIFVAGRRAVSMVRTGHR